jgi:phospholipase/carboxylesterase
MSSSQLRLPPEHLAEGFYPAEVESLQGRPIQTFVPTGYEPNYPYPLLVYFHGHGGNEKQVLSLAPQISRRNYVGIALRGPLALGPGDEGEPGFSWDSESLSDSAIEDYVFRAIVQTRRRFHIHSERIFLAGFWEGAAMAYRLALNYPEKFGGMIACNGVMPRRGCPLFRLDQLRGLRVHIGHGTANPLVPVSLARRDFRLLYTAGLPVKFRTYTTTHRLHSDMLRDVDQWLQDVIDLDSV